MSPRNGWEDIAYDDPDIHKLIAGGLIPWLVLTAATSLIGFIYADSFALLPALHGVICTFLMFFIAYYFGVFMFSFYMPSITKGMAIEQHNNTLILFSIGLLATIEMMKNCLPVNLAMLNFFPLYVLFIMWRGARYLKVCRQYQMRYVILSALAVIIPPYLLKVLFSLILPS